MNQKELVIQPNQLDNTKSENEQLKVELEQLKMENQQLISEHSLCLRKIAHEIGNALTLLSSSLQIVQSTYPQIQEYKYWNSAISDVTYLTTLIKDISIYNGECKISPSIFDINTLLLGIIDTFKGEGLYSNINFNIHHTNKVSDIFADMTKIKQLLINIIKNACDSIESSGIININISKFHEYVKIIIQDNGCGITPEQLKNIFTPLVTYKPDGTGLGLSICKKNN